jgi:hypothetical protein
VNMNMRRLMRMACIALRSYLLRSAAAGGP